MPIRFRHFAVATIAALSLSLAGCGSYLAPVTTTTATGKTVVSAAAVGSDLVTLGSGVQLASLLYATVATPDPTIQANLSKAASTLIATGNSLRTTGATSGDLTANINLAKAAVSAAVAGYITASGADPTKAAKLQAYADTFNAAVTLFESDFAASGLQPATTPVTAYAPAPVAAPALSPVVGLVGATMGTLLLAMGAAPI